MNPTPGPLPEQVEEDLITVKGDQLHKVMLLAALVISIAYTLFNILTGNFLDAIITSSLIPLTGLAWALFVKGHRIASKLLNLFQVNLAIAALSLISGAETFVVIFYLPALIGSLIALQGNERRLGQGLAVFTILLLIFSLTTEWRIGHHPPMSLQEQRLEWILNGVGAAVVILTQVTFMMKTNNLMQARLEQRSKDLKNQHDQLARTIENRDKIITIVSHDLRSPLLLLRSGLDMLKPGEMQADQQKALAMELGERTRRTVSLLDNLLQWSHDHSSSAKFELKDVSIETLRRYVNECFVLFGRDKDIHFKEKGESLAETRVSCDIRQIQTVLRNLITNAFKFTPPGGEVLVTTSQQGPRTEFRVTNSGKPMAPVLVERILSRDPFTMPGTNAETGHGLGLQLVQDLLHLHGSQLGIESNEANGTSFFFSLPNS